MIQEEEADIIRDLEGLLDQAVSQWLDFEEALSVFVEEFIATKLHLDPQNWDNNYTREIEDLGVKLERAPMDQVESLKGKSCKACGLK